MEILSPEAIIDRFKTAVGDGFINGEVYQREIAVKKNLFKRIWVYVKREGFRKAVEHICQLQEQPHLAIIAPSDRGDFVELNYLFTIYYAKSLQEITLGLHVNLPKNDLKIPTVTDLIPGAVFTEREIQEMMGIAVEGIPDKRRLFLSEDIPQGVYPWRTDETGPQDLLRVLPGRQQKQDT